MKKKILSTLIVIMLSLVAFGTISASAETEGIYTYTVSNGEATITECDTSASGEIAIPDTLEGYPVTKIGDSAFRDCTELTKVTIPNSVTQIGIYAFEACENLTSVTIPESIKKIDSFLFYNCINLTSVTIPDSITNIGMYAFRNCTNLKNIAIPDSVNHIGSDAFYNTAYYNNSSNWDNNCLYINNHLIEAKDLIRGDYAIKENTLIIGDYTFSGCKDLTSVTIPDSVTSIGQNAFSYCGISSITIPGSVKEIDYEAFKSCSGLKTVVIPNSVVNIADRAFYNCDSLTNIYYNGTEEEWNNISIGYNNNSLKEKRFFWYVIIIDENDEQLSKIMYDANSLINILDIKEKHGHTTHLYIDSERKKEYDLTTPIRENLTLYIKYIRNKYLSKFVDYDGDVIWEGLIDYGDVIKAPESPTRERTQQHTYTFAGWNGFTDGLTQRNQEMVFTATYDAKVNQYTYRFIDENGAVIKEETVDYGTTIELPEYTPKANIPQYTYTFLGWDGYTEGMVLTDDITFNVKYKITTNQYTYKFLDEDGSVLKEQTVDYGTIIIPPEISDKTEYYLFDYWKDYNEGMTVIDDVAFEAVFKYKNYTINADGLSEPVIVTYNSNFIIEPQKIDDYHYFIGYFTEENGKGSQITNEKGESLSAYNVVGDLTVYPYFYEGYMNKLEMQGAASAMPGDTIAQSAIFATDKDAMYLVATVKYPKHLSFKSIKGVDFKEATKDSEKVVGDYKYADITCVYDYEGNFAEINTNYIPFEIEFDVNTDITLGECEISIENLMLIGDDTYEIADIKNHTLTILPKLAESIEIIGKDEIDATEQFSAIVSPDYTTDKSVVWSVDDESVATITQDGTVIPVKNGTVVITATAKDGSEVFATKTVDVIAYAKINSIDFGNGVVLNEFNPDVRKYTVYVKENATSISLTPTFSGGGVLRPNGSGVWVSGRSKDFELNDTITTITLNRDNVTDMTDSLYTVTVVKINAQKTSVLEDGKTFVIRTDGLCAGNRVYLALYVHEKMVDMQTAIYDGEIMILTTESTYDKAKVLVWEDSNRLRPVCAPEIVK